MHVVMLGAPGAGKGTQADILSKELNSPHIASGDLFRQALEKRTKVGLLARSYMDKGELVPDEITIRMILERMDHPDCASGCLFDGFPRTAQQAEALDQALKERGGAIDKAIYIEVSDEELVKGHVLESAVGSSFPAQRSCNVVNERGIVLSDSFRGCAVVRAVQ